MVVYKETLGHHTIVYKKANTFITIVMYELAMNDYPYPKTF